MIGARKYPLFLPFFFLIKLLCPSVFGLLKLQQGKDTEKLMENAKPGVVYLFQFPRTSTSPSQAAFSLKVETWLKWEKIRFHRISNEFFLGSATDGTAPFAYYVDEKEHKVHWIYGSDAIIEFVTKIKGKSENEVHKKEENTEEKKLRNKIDDKLFKILMLDRATRDANGKGGLDWMLTDEGIAAQMMPMLVPNRKEKVLTIGTPIYITLNADSWKAYFDVYNFSSPNFERGKYFPGGRCPKGFHSRNPCEMAKIEFLQKFLEDKTQKDLLKYHFTMLQWQTASGAIRKVIEKELKLVFKDTPLNRAGEDVSPSSNSEKKLDLFLKENKISRINPFKPYYSLYGNGKDILKLLKKQLKPILEKLQGKTADFLFGADPTPADASLFGVLVQFFETPLNIPELRDFFKPVGPLTIDAQVLKDFVERVKKSQHLDEEIWLKLTQKPWTLNYEDIMDLYKDKFRGPFSVETDNLFDIFDNSDGENIKTKAVNAAVEKIEKYVKANKFVNAKTKVVLWRKMAAYLCNLGKERNMEKKCAKEHTNVADKYKLSLTKSIGFSKVKELTYEAVVEYNGELVRINVLKAIEEAKKIAANSDPKIAANASSDPKVGNEL